jgi:hypothetical protein
VGRLTDVVRLVLFLYLLGNVDARQNPDSKRAELIVWAQLKTLTPFEFKALLANAQGGEAEAQYMVGDLYEFGHLVQKN